MDLDVELCVPDITSRVPVQELLQNISTNDTLNELSHATLLPIVEVPQIVKRKQIRKKRLIIDDITKISSEDFYIQLENYGDTLRCAKPSDDIVLPYVFYQAMDKQKYKMLLHCLKNGGLTFKYISIKLQNNFHRGCKTTQAEKNDFSYIRNQDRKCALHTTADPIVLDIPKAVDNDELDGVIRATGDVEKMEVQNCFISLTEGFNVAPDNNQSSTRYFR